MKKYHLFGRDVDLEMTVRAFAEISDLCPDGDISSIDKMLCAPSGQMVRFSARCIAALSRGAEEQKAYDDPAYKPHPITEGEIFQRPVREFKAAGEQMMRILLDAIGTPEVEAEDAKKNDDPAAE